MANSANIVGKVVALQGQAIVHSADGSQHQLKLGDIIYENDVIVTDANGRVELSFDQGRTYVLRESETVTLDSTVFAPTQSEIANAALLPSDAAIAANAANAIIGGNSLDKLLEETAAGLGGGIASDAHDFVKLDRIAEAVTPQSYLGGFERSPVVEISARAAAVVDTTPPVITVNAPGNTADSTPTISGTSDLPAGSTITLVVTDHAGTPQTITTTVQPGGTYSATPATPLADGSYTVTATGKDTAGNPATANDGGSVETTVPIITVNAPGNTADSTPTISGTSDLPAGSTITLVVTDHAGTAQTITTTVQPDGTYNATPGNPLADGTYTVTATGKDAAGNPATANDGGSVDTVSTASITVDSITPDNILNAAESAGAVTVTGTVGGDAKAGDTVTLTVNGLTYTGLVSAGNSYSISVPGAGLLADSDKTVDASVTATDGAGNSTTATAAHVYTVNLNANASITVDSITPDNILNAAESASAVTVTGTVGGDAKVGDTVTLTVNGLTYTGRVGAGNSYSISVPGAGLLADCDKTVDASVTATDGAGNSTTASAAHVYTTDTSAAATLTVNSITPDNILNAAESAGTVAVSGTVGGDAKVGDTVTLTVNGVAYTGLV
ncbi:MAG: retention module-containing protein, partial [Undibacterium sp.]|uniref:retention module-containing protein n=1 Tax=Undibacterium sp. TaxID=1914977 RepID=UPI002725B31E